MASCSRVLFLFFLLVTTVFAGHPGSVDLNPRQATPGIRVDINEISPTGAHSITTKKYRLHVTGFPRDVVFSVFTKDFADSFVELATGFRVDEFGRILSAGTGQARRLDDIVFGPGVYPQGAVWEVAVVSLDRTITAFARVVPYPMVARDGPCLLSLELLTNRGDRFLVTGSGFTPENDVIAELRYDGRVEHKRRRVSSDGLLPRHVISHAAIGSNRSARYTVKGHSCELAIDYEWGEPALRRR